VVIEDIDFDNIPEIAVIGYHGEFSYPDWPLRMIIDIFRYDTSLVPVRHEKYSVDGLMSFYTDDRISGNISFSDVDGDEYLDLIAALNDAVLTISGTDIENNTANLQKIGSDNPCQTSAHAVDIDGTGNEEIVMASAGQVRILSVDASWNLSVLYSYGTGESEISSGPLVSDIDGDGYHEVIAGSKGVDENDNPYYQISILDHNLAEEPQWEPVKLYGIESGNIAVDDIDHDGKHDLFLMARTEESGILYVFGTPWSSGGEILLPTEKGNNQHTNASKRFVMGTFGGNITLCRKVEVVGDIQIGSPGTLFVAPGTDITVLDSDPLGGGAYPQDIEISCQGGVSIMGLENLEAVFHSSAAVPEAMDWYGLILETNNLGAEVNYCRISHAMIGINGKYSAEPITISRSSFRKNQTGLNLYNESIEISYTNAAYNTNTGMILAGYPVAPVTVLLDHCTLENNYYNGLTMAFATGVVQHTTIRYNGTTGLLCLGASACPEVKNSCILDNDCYGVQAFYDASPILGDNSTGEGGNNSIYNSPVYVYQAYSSSYTVIMAQNCYWGTEEGMMPAPGYFKPYFTGNIVYNPILLYDPLAAAAPTRKEKKDETRIALAQNYPNPFKSGGTSICYTLPSGRSKVSLKVYDVAGRTVKTLVDAVQTSGTYHVEWDGLNNNGSKVAQGIYFYRLIAGDETVSRKMIFLR
jgi:hypothetical protein